MKFSKPQYDAKEQIYRASIQDGIQIVNHREDGTWKESFDTLFQSISSNLIQQTIQHTQGWFSKPLTPEYLKPRLQFQCPTEEFTQFEGSVIFELSSLSISKQSFLFYLSVLSTTPFEKCVIDLAEGEEEVQDNKSESPPLEDDAEPLTVGPTRRRLMKIYVMRARARAAKACFKAEEMARAYCDAFGEETDWDESDEEDEDSDFEEDDA